jgi:putative transposase
MKQQSRTVGPRNQAENGAPGSRYLPLVELLVDIRAELMEIAVASGLKVLQTMLEEDRGALCGPRYAHQADRRASRFGTAPSEVVLGGRKVVIRRPRVRSSKAEVPLPTFQAVAATDPLERRAVEQMLLGVATRQYARSLEPVGSTVQTRGTSKSTVSRRFVVRTTAQLEAWRATPLDGLDLVALIIDGVSFGDHCVIAALGIDASGQKHALGLWDGSTENTTICQALLANLESRGLRTDRSLLVIVDGGKGVRKAVAQTFGQAAWIQRCQVHKLRNVLEHLPEAQRPWVRAILCRAYRHRDPAMARRLLQNLAARLDDSYPDAAASVREGLEETLTVVSVNISDRLRRSFATTNAIESLFRRTRHTHRNVTRWRGGRMILRWAAAGVLEATKGFRRLKGCADMPKLVAALRARDRQLGLGATASIEDVA